MESRTLALHIVRTLRRSGFEAYFAGGCVRDELLGRTPKDFDVATSAKPEDVQKLFPQTVPVGVAFGVVLVVAPSGDAHTTVEVATFRSDGGYVDGRRPTSVAFVKVEEDASRRDFTINGMYLDPETGKVLDFVGGQADLKKRVVRTIGDADARFLEDHLRLLRAARFSIELDFALDPSTAAAVRKHAPLIAKVSAERIRVELGKIFTSPRPGPGLRLLDELGLLAPVIPEMQPMKGCEQSPEYHPEGDVWTHTGLLLDQLSSPELELALGALLHDVAKPPTQTRDADGRIRFFGHDKMGADMARTILRRLAFPNAVVDLVAELVLEHLRFKDAPQMREATLKRFFRIPRFDLHLELHRIDCGASHKKMDLYEFCKERYERFQAEPKPAAPLVRGEDVRALGVAPGPRYRELLDEVEDAVLEGRVKERSEALLLLAKLVQEGGGGGKK